MPRRHPLRGSRRDAARRHRTRRLRPGVEPLEGRVVMDGAVGAWTDPAWVGTVASPPRSASALRTFTVEAGAADDGWIESFNHPLPDPNDAAKSHALGLLRFVSTEAWVNSSDGRSIVFGQTDSDWTLIGLDAPGQPYKPILAARGVVTLTPDGTEANPFSWSVGLYIVRNDTSSGDNVLGGYQLLTTAGSLSADAVAGTPTSPIKPPGAAISGALPLSMIQDQAASGVSAAFTPTNMLLQLDPATGRSVLRFEGGQSVAYKGSRFKFGIGGTAGNASKALTIDETGSLALVDETNGQNSVTVTAAFGGDQSEAIAGVSELIYTVIETSGPHGLAPGDAFHFEGLVNPNGIADGTTYYVYKVLDDSRFYFSAEMDGVPVYDATADAGGDVVVAGKFRAGGFALSGSVQVTFAFLGQGGVSFPNPADGWKLSIAGAVDGEFATAAGGFDGTLSVTLGSSDYTVPGIVIERDKSGTVTIPDWAFVLNGDFKFGKADASGGTSAFVDLSVSNLGVTNTFDPATHLGTLRVNGGLTLAVAGWSTKFSAMLGDGATHDGLVLVQDASGVYKVQSFYGSVTATKEAPTKPADDTTFLNKLKLHDFALTLEGNVNPDGSVRDLDVWGDVSLAVGDQTPDGSGNWPSTVSLVGAQLTAGALTVTDTGITFPGTGTIKFTASGSFKIGPLELVAQNLVLEYQGDGSDPQNSFFLIGGTITLPQLKGVSVTLGAGGNGDGLKIFPDTGHWQLDGFKLVVPEIVVGPIELDDVTIGFSEQNSQNWDLLVGGTIVLLKEGSFKGTRIAVQLQLGEQNGNFIVEGFGVDLRGLDPGIPILDTGGFITDIGLDAQNLNKSDFSIAAVIGAAFGESIQVGGNSYALVQVTAQGKYVPGDIDITGSLLLAGGLASGAAQVDLDYGIGRYLIDLDMKFYEDFLDGHIRIVITPGKFDALATLDLNVPDFIPVIGGYNIGEVGAALELTTERPLVASVAAGVVTTADPQFMRVGDPFKFTYLTGADPSGFDLTQVYYVTSVGDGGKEFTFSATADGAPITGLAATGGRINPGPQIVAGWAKFLFWEVGVEYDFLAEKFALIGKSAIQQINANIPSGVNTKTYTYNYDFTPPAPASGAASQALSTASSGLFQFSITATDPATQLYATIDGQTAVVWTPASAGDSYVDVNGVRFHYVGSLSKPGNIILHASAASNGPFDPYLPLPLLPITFTLTSDLQQPDPKPDPNDATKGWHGKFTAPPPQVQGFSVVPPPTDALGNPLTAADPNLVTVNFQYRTTDPKNTLLNFYYDFDTQGGDGRRFLTVRASDLQAAAPADPSSWQQGQVTWDLRGLPDFAVFAYVVATDGVHSPTAPLYSAQSVLPQPQLIAQVDVQNPSSEKAVSANDLPGWLFSVTPVNQSTVTGVAAASPSDPTSVVTTAAAHGLTPGQAFVFQQLQNPTAGLVDGQTYYVATVPTPATFTFAVAPSQAAVTGQSAQGGVTYVDPSNGTKTLALLSDANGHANFYFDPTVQWVRVKVWEKQPGFLPLPVEGEQQAGADGSLTEYILIDTDDKNQVFTYQKTGLVQGRVFRDVDATGTRTLPDPGVAGVTVYLDLANDGKLDPTDPRVTTSSDGVYRFLHTFTPEAPSFSGTVRYVLPEGLKANSSAATPFNITSGQPWATADDFLLIRPVTLSGVVFADLNDNGKRDPGEPGLPGYTLTVTPASGPAARPVTDAQGYWSVQFDAANTFQVALTATPGNQTTPTDPPTYAVDATQRTDFGGLVFGVGGVAAPAGTGVSGVVFSDLNGNGVHDPGEPGLPGYTVELTGIDGRQATTSGGPSNPGEFHFTSASNFAFLRTVLPANANGTTPANGPTQFVPAIDLAALGVAVGANVDARVSSFQQNPGLNDVAVLTGDRVILALASATGPPTVSTLTTGLAPATSGMNTLLAVDVNGDKLIDLVAAANGGVVVFISNGFGRFAAPIPVLTAEFAGKDAVVAVDATTGPPTFYAANTSAAGTSIYSFAWDPAAKALAAPKVVSNPTPIDDLAVGDVNGDGATDLVMYAQNGKLWAALGPSFGTSLGTDPAPAPASRLVVSKLFGDAYARATYVGRVDSAHGTVVVGGFLNGALIATQTAPFSMAAGVPAFALPATLRGGGNLVQDVLVGAGGDLILFTNPGLPFSAQFKLTEGAHFGSSTSVASLDPPAVPSPAAPPVADAVTLDLTGATTVIDTTNLTVTGDGDNDPNKIFGRPFTARVVNGVAEFIVAGDLSVPAVTVTVAGAHPASLVVGGDLTVAPGTVFDVSANGQTPGVGGGGGGAGNNGGAGGGGGPGGPMYQNGAGRGSIGIGGDIGAGSPGGAGANGQGGQAGGAGNPGNAGAAGGGGFNNPSGAGGQGAPGSPAAGGPAGPVGGGGGGGDNGNYALHNGPGHNGGNGSSPAGPGGTGPLGQAGGVGNQGKNDVTSPLLTGGGGGGGGAGGTGGGGGGGGGAGGTGGSGGGGLGVFDHGGMVIRSATFDATGGAGTSGTPGTANRTGGGPPNPGSVTGSMVGQTGGSGGTWHYRGGNGGNGAVGAAGGDGGYGGNGGAGGGGAGGTVIISASVLDATGLTVNADGGAGGAGLPTNPANPGAGNDPNGPAGGQGRLLFNSNANIDAASWRVSARTAAADKVAVANPFVSGGPTVPAVPGLVGGAYAYGLLPAGALAAPAASQAPGATVALIRTHLAFGGFDFPGYDQIMLVNLSATETLSNPMLGAGAPGFLAALKQGGIANDPAWGGAGPTAVTTLAPGQVYVTLVPSATQQFNVQATFGGRTHSAGSPVLLNGQVMYLTANTYAGLTAADLDRDGQVDLLGVSPDGTLTTWHNVTGGSILFDVSPSKTAGGHDIGVQIAGSAAGTVVGTVFQDVAGNGVWNPSQDPGLSSGVLVYVDLNNNNALDPGEPSQAPSLEGAYRIGGLPMADKQGNVITYHVRVALGVNNVSNTFTQTYRASAADFSFNAPGATVNGADFGVKVAEGANDFNQDGHADIVLTDPADGGVYVQFRNASGRLHTKKLGNLPGGDWRVGAVGEFNGDATPDVLLVNERTGALTLWEVIGGDDPRVARSTPLALTVPAGSALAAVGDLDRNGTPDLFFQDTTTGDVSVRLMQGASAVGTRELPRSLLLGALVDVALLDDDIYPDLVWKTLEGDLVATLLDRDGAPRSRAVLGRLAPGAEVAGSANLNSPRHEDLLIQDVATGRLTVWSLAEGARGSADRLIDLGPAANPLTALARRSVSVVDVFADRPLVVSGAGLTAPKGEPFTAVLARFNDPDPAASAGRYVATVDWGDGGPATVAAVRPDGAGGFEVVGTHAYPLLGNYVINVAVVDTTRGPGGRRGTASAVAEVLPAPSPGVGPKVLDVRAFNPGPVGPTFVTVSFDRPLDPARAANPRNYFVGFLRGGPRPRFVPVRVRGAHYDPAALNVTLALGRRVDPNAAGLLRIVTNGRRGLTDASGQRMTDAFGRPAGFLGRFGGGNTLRPFAGRWR